MTAEQDYATHTVDLLEGLGHREARRMPGGYAIFHPGLMFGLIADRGFYPKADEQSRELFNAEDGSAFGYYDKERGDRLYCYQAADIFFEDSDACRRRACIAFAADLRNPDDRKRRKS